MRAISTFNFEEAISTRACRVRRAFRIGVRLSERGWLGIFEILSGDLVARLAINASNQEPQPTTDGCASYQLDLVTPGISPLRASCRKQSRHMSNLPR